MSKKFDTAEQQYKYLAKRAGELVDEVQELKREAWWVDPTHKTMLLATCEESLKAFRRVMRCGAWAYRERR